MKIDKISHGLSGVIPLASYENSRPSFNIEISIDNDSELEAATKFCQDYLHRLMDSEIQRGKVEYIERAYTDKIRWYTKNGRKYPSVTQTQIGWWVSVEGGRFAQSPTRPSTSVRRRIAS